MIRMFLKVIFVFVAILSAFKLSLAYNGQAHSEINEKIAREASQIDTFLKKELRIPDGINSQVKRNGETKRVWQWIAYGGEAEDFGKRYFNHFHDPLKNWDEAGLDSIVNYYYGSPLSSILWGFSSGRQEASDDWSWSKAREYYFNYLSGEDYNASDENLANCLRAVGQIMHLLQDASVPLHTRNDIHPLPGTYEDYANSNLNLDQLNKRPSFSFASITDLIDKNFYNGGSLPFIDAIGLAEYSNANFLTEDTMFTYPHPNLSDTDCDPSIWVTPGQVETIDAQDGEQDRRIYFRKIAGEPVDHLMAASYWYEEIYSYDGWNSTVRRHAFILDEQCYADYAAKLIPRAANYSAELLNYFFRGNLQVASIPVFQHDGLYAFILNIKNLSDRQESMSDGRFSLLVRYMPSDGSGERFVHAYDVDVAQLNYDEDQMFQFFLPQIVPLESVETVECTLAYRGKLGNESDAVIGKVFLPGKTKFIEEWDNGLTGNHPWYHTPSDYNVDNGELKNIIENGALMKENLRYTDDDRGRINESLIYFTEAGSPYQHLDPNSPDGILITPNTFVQFRINDMSINEDPPAPEGYTNAYQYLQFEFNALDNGSVVPDYLALQFVSGGSCINLLYSREACYSFQFGSIIVFNVYDRLRSQGFTIPEPFYLQVIHLNQFLNFLEEPSTTEHRQRMEVDFISIVEASSE